MTSFSLRMRAFSDGFLRASSVLQCGHLFPKVAYRVRLCITVAGPEFLCLG